MEYIIAEYPTEDAAAKYADTLNKEAYAVKYNYLYMAAELPNGKWGIICSEPHKPYKWLLTMK
jgi:hypothetical protein